MHSTRLRALRALPRRTRPSEPSCLRAVRLAGHVAGAALRGVRGAPSRVRSRSCGDRVRRASAHIRPLVKGERTEASGGGGRSAGCGGRRGARCRRPRARSRRSRARLEAWRRRSTWPGSCSRGSVGAAGRGHPAASPLPSSSARARPRGAATQCPRQRLGDGRRAPRSVPRRRRLHLGSDGRRVRIRAAEGRCSPSRRGHPREGGALVR